MTYKARTSSWPEIVAFYQDLVREHAPMQPMLALVEWLAASRYARSLACTITNEGLSMGPAAEFQRSENELQVRFDPRAHRFTFVHIQRPNDPRPWSRDCGADEARNVLERTFHKRLHWFHEG
jgi:hypothetical protein